MLRISLVCLWIATCVADAQSPPVRPKLPAIQNRAWIEIPLDAFILHRLEAEKLKPAAEASREEVLKRLTLHVAGRPATKTEIDAFVATPIKRAYEKELDRLLNEPGFDQRFADVRRVVRKVDPTSAREAVGRCWQRLFGQPLTNADAVEWLACELIDPMLVNCCELDRIPESWDVKHLVRAIATSAIYRQSSTGDAETTRRDPANRLFGRGP